jgi:hypothetical protein
MSKPGRGWAALLVTTNGTVYGFSSRGCNVTVSPHGLIYFRPAAVSPLSMSLSLSEPLSGVPAYDDVTIEIENTGWWIANHTGSDRLDAATVTIYRETDGTFDPTDDVAWNGFVLRQGGVSAANTRVRLTCRDVFGYYAEGATVGGRNTLNVTTFPYLEPPPVVGVTLNASGSAGSDEIVRLGVATNHGYAATIEYAGPWPAGPTRISGLSAGSTTFTVVGRNAALSIIFSGQTTETVPSSGSVQLWICPEDVDATAPESVSNPDEDKPIGTVFGRYSSGAMYVPCFVYDWMQSSASVCRYVYEDLQDLNGAAMTTRTSGNHDVILIDTQPPTTDVNEEPIENPRTYVDDYTSISRGEFFYLRKDGSNTIPSVITWDAPGGPGNDFGCFNLNVTVLNAWWRALSGKDDFVFDPARFRVLTQSGGAKSNDASYPVGLHAYRTMDVAFRLLVEHMGIPSSYLDTATMLTIDSSVSVDVRRYLTSAEPAADLYAALMEECQILHYIKPNGKISWRLNEVAPPPPAVIDIDERNTIVDSIEWTANDWGPYFNAVVGQRDQGLPYQPDLKLSPRPEQVSAIVGTASGPAKALYSYTFKWLWDGDAMDAYLAALLIFQGYGSDTVRVTVRAFDSDLDDQLAIGAGDTVGYSYIASRISSTVERLYADGSLFRVLGVTHAFDVSETTLTLWKMGTDPNLSQSAMLMMSGTETFSDGSSMGTSWNAGWTTAQKQEAANWGSGKGGWMSEVEGQILSADTSPYAISPMG